MPKLSKHSAPKRFQGPKEIGLRLRLIRVAYSRMLNFGRVLSQSEFARMLDIGITAWNNSETGDARIGIDNAIKLRRKTGVPLDYIYEGDESKLPAEMARAVSEVEGERNTA